MRSTHQVLPSFFHPLNFTAYACGLEKPNLRPEWAHLGEQTMEQPSPVNLMTPDEVRANGWQAECRDKDGHLTRTHAPFRDDESIVWLVREALEHGDTITIWPTA